MEHPKERSVSSQETGRIVSLDVVRGIGILGVVFLHFALYNYSGLLQIDFDDPPFVITVIGFLLTWAGLFAIVSGTVYGFRSWPRLSRGTDQSAVLRSLVTAGVVLLVLHYFYFLVLGPTLLDLDDGNHQYSILVGFINTGEFIAPSFERVFYNTSLSMLGWNLILTGLVLFLLVRKSGAKRLQRNRWILLGIAGAVLMLSAIRIPLFPLIERAIEDRRPLTMILAAIFINKNDPILPYLGFGMIGTAFGITIAGDEPRKKIAAIFNSVAGLCTVAGIAGLLLLPDSMLERSVDGFWFFLVLFQCGFFTVIVVNAVIITDYPRRERAAGRHGSFTPLRFVGMVSLTLFLIESPVSALLARFWEAVLPGWNDGIPILLGLSAVNLIGYAFILWLWRSLRFVFTAEWIVAGVHRVLGRATEKLTALRGLSGNR